MLIYFLGNLGMGGGGTIAPVSYVDPSAGSLLMNVADAGLFECDPDAGSLISTADDRGLDEVDPSAGSLILP